MASRFQELLPAEFLDQAQTESGVRRNNGVYTPLVVLWLLIWQRLQGGASLECAVVELLQGLPETFWPRPCKRIRDWREHYPSKTRFNLRRISGEGGTWIAEILISYDGGPWKFGIGLYRFRGDKVIHEAVYVMDGFDAAEWRAPWATRFDPLASIPAAEWREDRPFGLDIEREAVGSVPL